MSDALQKADLLIADLRSTSQAIDASFADTTSTAVKIDELQGQLLQIEPIVASSVVSVATDKDALKNLQEKTGLLKDAKAHYTDSQDKLENLKKNRCSESLKSCTRYCCGEMISTISGAVSAGLVFQTTLAAVLGGLGGAVIGCGCLYGCYRAKKKCTG